MTSERLEVRLDEDRKRKLTELAAKDRATVAEFLRRTIDRLYEDDIMRERRMEAARRISEMQIGEPLEPAELSKLLDEAHSPGNLY